MDLVQFSNLLNLTVQASPDISSYQYGWVSDINTSRQNNYDPTGEVGKMYPHLLFTPPTVTFRMPTETGRQSYRCKLILFDLYGYNNTTAIDTRTMVEVHRDLSEAVLGLLNFLEWYAYETSSFQILDAVVGSLDGVGHDDALLFIELDLNVVLIANCGSWNLEEADLPSPFENFAALTDTDLEKQTADKWTLPTP